MSLSRHILLKDSNKDKSTENLEYVSFNKKNKILLIKIKLVI